ncbi:16687_t:CDS:2 [Cetraspora pellucida]|uniref:16687_t:CDS:1 n=1 Tax=Cetraspora pellucida TaxID=1433469 RepID=A0ACA9M5K0_9GLOM|nr:16687_t:CDS:2 [Cetraspora pellucida]
MDAYQRSGASTKGTIFTNSSWHHRTALHHTTPLFLVLNDLGTNDTILLETQITEIHVDNGFLNSYDANAEKDPDKEACTYIESNWELFEQAFRRICTKKAANNW